MHFILARNGITLTYIELFDEEVNDEQYCQRLVDFVLKGLTDSDERSVYRTKLIGPVPKNGNFKEIVCNLYDENINVVPDKSTALWIVIDKNNLHSLHKIFFQKDNEKYQKTYLNNILSERTQEFISDKF